MLRGEGYQVGTAASGEEGLAALKKESYDLVLLDIGLPGMNGIEALAEIKRLSPDILVIMITAFEDIDTVISAMKLGAFDYLIKPTETDDLSSSLPRGRQVRIGSTDDTWYLSIFMPVTPSRPLSVAALNAVAPPFERASTMSPAVELSDLSHAR